MKRYLFIINTYYQLIMALQMRYTIFSEDEVIVFISDASRNAEQICQKLNEGNYFSVVRFFRADEMRQKTNLFGKAAKLIENIRPKKNRYKRYFEGIENLRFDEIISFNVDIMTYNFYSILYEYNRDLKYSGFEEGLLSYNAQILDVRYGALICKARNFFGKKSFTQAYKNFYCFFPQLYKREFNAVKVPAITHNDQIIKALQEIFDVHEIANHYSQKYIFFSSVYDFEGGKPIGEYDVVNRIATKVGKENLLVKLHPRDIRTIYEDNGFVIDSFSAIPWEVIQLTGDFDDKVFLTATSGSVLAGSFMSSSSTKVFYLFELCDLTGNALSERSAGNIKKLLSDKSMGDTFRNVSIANSIEEIIQ